MGYRHSATEILEAAVDEALEHGLATLGFRRVAERLGIADRTVVYYFATKDELVVAVLGAIGERLQSMLASVASGPFRDHRALAAAVWPVLAKPRWRSATACYLEAIGLAGTEPYRSVAPVLTGAWVEWAAANLTGTAAVRRREAEAALAMIDGLLVLSHLLGVPAANRALAAMTA